MAKAKRSGPSDPQAIAAERVKTRALTAEARHRGRMHGLRAIAEAEVEHEFKLRGVAEERQGVSDALRRDDLAIGAGVELKLGKDGARQKVLSAERADPFNKLWRAGGVDDRQYAAAQRLVRDAMLANGVRDADTWRTDPRPGDALSDPVSQGMIDAGKRMAAALALVGLRDRRLLERFVELQLKGEQTPWRDVVAAVTGVSEKHRQGQVVEDVLENLRLAHDALDREAGAERRRRAEAANDTFATKAR